MKKKILENIIDDVKVFLVTMPYAPIERSSLALSILKSCLSLVDISSQVIYGNIEFLKHIDKSSYNSILKSFRDIPQGEWTFSSIISENSCYDKNFFDLLKKKYSDHKLDNIDEHIQFLCDIRSRTYKFIDTLAIKIIKSSPKIIGCSSSFQQNCASLALLKKIKEYAPHIITLMGGANCEKEMGAAIIKNYDYIDFVVSGEPEEYFGSFCEKLIRKRGRLQIDEIPHGVLSKQFIDNINKSSIPRSFVKDLDLIPLPDHSDYFNVINDIMNVKNITLPFEMSRGCWWGVSRPCTFCGLNGDARKYRTRSAAKVISDIHELSEQYNIKKIECVDNAIPPAYIDTVFSKLKHDQYNIFCEVRSSLSKEQIFKLRNSGVTWVQPGIESLHDELLRLMNKGVTAIQNIQFLKYALEAGMYSSWNMISDFPEEHEQWYLEICNILPLISHLQPPSGLVQVSFDRFNEYHMHPDKYGLDLKPLSAYTYIYGLSGSNINNMAYFFEDENAEHPLYGNYFETPGKIKLQHAIIHWKTKFWSDHREILSMSCKKDQIDIIDLRSCAVSFFHTLTGLEQCIYLECETSKTIDEIYDSFCKKNNIKHRKEIEQCLHILCDKKLMLYIGNKYLSLAVNGIVPKFIDKLEFPCGIFIE